MVEFSEFIPNIDIGGTVSVLSTFISVIIVALIVAVLIFMWIRNKKYKYKIVIFEDVAGRGHIPVGKDKARLHSIGDTGEEVLYLRKAKKMKQAYGNKKVGENTYWFVIGSDGYWRNVVPEYDDEGGKLDLKPTDRDMRYMHVALGRNLKERFDKQSFLQKYGGVLAYFGLIAITGIMMFLLFDKWMDVSQAANGAVEAATKVVEQAERLLAAVDSFDTSGSIQPAP